MVGDKPQSGEPGDTILPLVFFFFFFLEQEAVCVLHSLVRRPGRCQHLGSFCTTDNHWADDVTSKALVKDIVVPFFRRKINQLRAVNGPALHGGGG
jgi:hypothetical protein